jgi:hypothetical protein
MARRVAFSNEVADVVAARNTAAMVAADELNAKGELPGATRGVSAKEVTSLLERWPRPPHRSAGHSSKDASSASVGRLVGTLA